MNRMILTTALALPLVTAPALADNWTGAYGGINLGYAWGDVDASYDEGGGDAFGFISDDCGSLSTYTKALVCEDSVSDFSLIDGSPIGSADADGVLLGATFGINQQFGNWVVGIEADIVHLGLSESHVNDSSSLALGDASAASIELPPDVELNIDSGLGVFASLRAGFAFNNDQTLVYGKAGYGGADLGIKVGFSCIIAEICGDAWSDDFSEAFIYGAGIEHMITKTMSVKIEYLRMEFDEVIAISEGAFDPGYDAYEFDVSVDTVKVGLNFKLGSPL